jgi:gliding motility-associated peptidyl-prolyl isomerase
VKQLLTILLVTFLFFGCNQPEVRRPVSVKSSSFIDKSVALNKSLNNEQHERIQHIIQNNPETKFIASPNGFWYYYNVKVEGDSITPKFGNIVNFNYDVTDFNNATIYSQEELKTQNYAMDQEEIFSGLREGLKFMKAGETITFLFPSDKAYGYYGDENKIGANISIICTVTINSITQKETN